MGVFKFLFLGDVVGRPGRVALNLRLASLKEKLHPDFTVVNGENSAGGLGIEIECANEILGAGADAISTGNHIWKKKTFRSYLDKNPDKVIRPHNFPPGAPGRGWLVREIAGIKVAVVNLMGRIFMTDLVDCPFRCIDALLSRELRDCDLVFVDFHAEATSEKAAFAYHLDGRATAVMGTHTHVQTADERILPQGTAFITDVGMCGPSGSIIGVEPSLVVQRFYTGLPLKYDTGNGDGEINGVLVTVDLELKRAIAIERLARS